MPHLHRPGGLHHVAPQQHCGDAAEFPYLHPAVAAWFGETFGEPSPPQALGWPAIAAGENVLIIAPTGSGKTLAAFLVCLSWLYNEAQAGQDIDDGVRVLYISPLRALNNDIYRNLEVPLAGIDSIAGGMGFHLPRLRAAVRTGDTPPRERNAIVRRPPHILITTPESLFLMLCSKARRIFRPVRFVIVDEIHSLFPTKRGAHLALTLEYLQEIAARPFVRIGLSATVRPAEEVGAFLGGGISRIIDTGQRKTLDLSVETPVEDLRELPEKTIWPDIYKHLLDLVMKHKSTIIFVNNRQVAERVAAHLNELANELSGEDVARVHHGSVSREMRLDVEELLKAGKLRAVVATSSLELGIDIGSVDLVIQVESPHEVARGLQRVGRAGHLLSLPSKGRIVVKTRADLLEAACIAREMGRGRIEEMHTPVNCLDVLAQTIVGFSAAGPISEERLFQIVRRAYNYRELPRQDFETVLSMLSGGQGAEEFADLRPSILWDRSAGVVEANARGKRLLYTNAGTIPDRGYYGVYTEARVRIGELDEEFVYERRVGDRFPLGTNVWQINEIGHDRVIVSSTGKRPTVLPFWRGEGFGRPYELSLTFGEFLEEAYSRLDHADFEDWIRRECFLEGPAARNLKEYLDAQRKATGVLPSHRRILIEEFRDELGEWRVAIHSIFGGRVNGPLAMLISSIHEERTGLRLEFTKTDDGILFLCPAGDQPPRLDPSLVANLDWEAIRRRLEGLLRDAPLFGLLFRHAAARALVLPRLAYGKRRTPLWLSRLKAADLLGIVDGYPDFPIALEAYREAMGEVLDIRGLRQVLEGIRSGSIEVIRHRRRAPSPFASPLLFGFMSAYLYGQDIPKRRSRRDMLAPERREAAPAGDRVPTPGGLPVGEGYAAALGGSSRTAILREAWRRSRAFEPREPKDFAAFLSRWHGVNSPEGGLEAVRKVLRQLSYCYFPVVFWENSIMPVRVQNYEPALLDRAFGSGGFRWVANRDSVPEARIAVYPVELGPGPLTYRPSPGEGVLIAAEREEDRKVREKLLAVLREKGALFLPEIWQYSGLTVWDFLRSLDACFSRGEITNDVFEPVRYLGAVYPWGIWETYSPWAPTPSKIPLRLIENCGRWSIVEPHTPKGESSPGSIVEFLCEKVLDLYGIATRETVDSIRYKLHSTADIQWSEIWSLLRKWEALGRVERGYFVKGFSGVQYALPEAIEGLALPREAGLREFWWLRRYDPANPWWRFFPWWPGLEGKEKVKPKDPHTFVLRKGAPVLVAQGEKSVSLLSLAPLSDEELALALIELVHGLELEFYAHGRVEVVAYNGSPVMSTPAAGILRELGFERGYKNMVKWLGPDGERCSHA